MNDMQRNEAWFQERLGRVTASRIGDLMARTKTGWGASRANYMAELICERLTGVPTEGFQSAAMLRGIDLEPAALAAYCFDTDLSVDLVGFIPHPEIPDAGCSPDGLVGKDGLVEVKVPNAATHIETLLTETVDLRYVRQMAFQMACTGRQWCDFVSYDPRMPAGMQMWVKRYERDDTAIKAIEVEVMTFLGELCDKVAALRQRFGGAA